MKNTYIIIVLILILGGLWLFLGKGRKAEAPMPDTVSENAGVISNTMPVLGPEGQGVPEMVVE
ncbi:MAG: hypothetical protein Q8O46_05460 [bacterium]|nr:hypothetical protein [bacterium]